MSRRPSVQSFLCDHGPWSDTRAVPTAHEISCRQRTAEQMLTMINLPRRTRTDIEQQTNELFNQIVNKSEHCLHYRYPLQENSLSLIVSELPTNCRAHLHRLTDSKTLLFAIL